MLSAGGYINHQIRGHHGVKGFFLIENHKLIMIVINTNIIKRVHHYFPSLFHDLVWFEIVFCPKRTFLSKLYMSFCIFLISLNDMRDLTQVVQCVLFSVCVFGAVQISCFLKLCGV